MRTRMPSGGVNCARGMSDACTLHLSGMARSAFGWWTQAEFQDIAGVSSSINFA
jgi:hypothetical protein